DTMSGDEFDKYMNDTIAKGEEPGDEQDEVEIDGDGDQSSDATEIGTDTTEVDLTVDDDSEEIDEEDKSEDELEQPQDDNATGDSDNLTDDDNVDDEDDAKDSTEDADTSEAEVVEQTKAEPEVDSKEPETVQSYKIKANGTEFEFTNDELLKLAPKALDYTRKMQEIAPWREQISAMKENNIGKEDLNNMIDVLKGDKNAVHAMLKKAGIDALDLDIEGDESYKPTDYGKSTGMLDIEDITSEISKDREFVITQNVIAEQWDDESRTAFADNPQLIKALHEDVKNGDYDIVSPIAMKLKLFGDGKKSDLDYYKEAAIAHYSQKKQVNDAQVQAERTQQAEKEAIETAEREKIAQVKANADKRKADKAKANKARNASVTSSNGKKDVVDYLDVDAMSDDEFSKLMDKEIHKRK
ncbi:MAG: hypothetical protein DRH15_11995, partial [Deltaproteobacteria bacterium]